MYDNERETNMWALLLIQSPSPFIFTLSSKIYVYYEHDILGINSMLYNMFYIIEFCENLFTILSNSNIFRIYHPKTQRSKLI